MGQSLVAHPSLARIPAPPSIVLMGEASLASQLTLHSLELKEALLLAGPCPLPVGLPKGSKDPITWLLC